MEDSIIFLKTEEYDQQVIGIESSDNDSAVKLYEHYIEDRNAFLVHVDFKKNKNIKTESFVKDIAAIWGKSVINTWVKFTEIYNEFSELNDYKFALALGLAIDASKIIIFEPQEFLSSDDLELVLKKYLKHAVIVSNNVEVLLKYTNKVYSCEANAYKSYTIEAYEKLRTRAYLLDLRMNTNAFIRLKALFSEDISSFKIDSNDRIQLEIDTSISQRDYIISCLRAKGAELISLKTEYKSSNS